MDCRAKKAALFFLACEANSATRLSLPAAMRAKGYSDVEAADRILVQQVRRKSQKKAPKDIPRPESAAASSSLALATVATPARPALRSILMKQTVAPFPLVRGYEGMMSQHAFELLVLTVESFVQISNVNSIDAKCLTLMMAVNTCCGVAPA